jgi:hypothetical protein
MTDKDRVLSAHPDASCSHDWGLYQILRPRSETSPSPLSHESLSSQQLTEDLAWHFAAARVRIEDRAKAKLEVPNTTNGEIFQSVLRQTPGRLLSNPKAASRRRQTLYPRLCVLSGRFSNERLAWQDAAKRVSTENLAKFDIPPTYNSLAQSPK